MHAFIHWALLRIPSGLFSPPSDHGLFFPRYPEEVHSVNVRLMKRKSASKNSDSAFILLTAKNIQRVFAFLFGVISVAQFKRKNVHKTLYHSLGSWNVDMWAQGLDIWV